MLAIYHYEQNERGPLPPAGQPTQTPQPTIRQQGSLLFKQIRLKVANLREAEAAGLVAPGTADKFLEEVQAIVAQYT